MGGECELLDDMIGGYRFAVICNGQEAADAISPQSMEYLDVLGTKSVALDENDEYSINNFMYRGMDYLLVRPDRVIFGAAPQPGFDDLVQSLKRRLSSQFDMRGSFAQTLGD